MKFHEISMVGKYYIEELNTLPTWTESDKKRLVFVQEKLYYGGESDWIEIAISDLLTNHIEDTNNPHQVTLNQLNGASEDDLNDHINNTNNPHQITLNQLNGASEDDLNDHINNTIIHNPSSLDKGFLYCDGSNLSYKNIKVKIDKYTTTGPHTWTKPDNFLYAEVWAVGGGQNSYGKNGASGEFVMSYFTDDELNSTETVYIGGTSTSTRYQSSYGENTTFGTNKLIATGAGKSSEGVGDFISSGGGGGVDTDGDGSEESEGSSSFFGSTPAYGAGSSTHGNSIVRAAKNGALVIKSFYLD